MQIVRRYLLDEIYSNLKDYPVIGIIGPRQVGKSTLVKYIQENLDRSTIYIDLQLPSDRVRLDYPEDYLNNVKAEIIIIDEIQKLPELFGVIRALVDQISFKKQFIILGSASPRLIRQSSESLAGRISYHELTSFNFLEIQDEPNKNIHWLRGGYPRSFLFESDRNAFLWLRNYISTFIERDLADLGLNLSRDLVEKTIFMLASIHGQLLNSNMISRSLGVTNPTIRKYIEILHGAFIVRLLKPYTINIKKRLVKSPKIYIRDTGILHELSGVRSAESLSRNIIIGTSWEGYVIEQLYSISKGKLEYYFYRTHNDAEIDLIIKDYHGKLWAIEIKNTNAPKLSRGFHESVKEIKPDYQFVITPGATPYQISKEIKVTNLQTFVLDNFLPLAFS